MNEFESAKETEEVSGFNPRGSCLFESSRLRTGSNRFLPKVARPDLSAAGAAVFHRLWISPDREAGSMPMVHNEISANAQLGSLTFIQEIRDK